MINERHINLFFLYLLFQIAATTTANAQEYRTETIQFNSDKDFKILFDYYHHNLPHTKVGKHIVTGSWLNSDGRYGWDDFVHTNTFDHAYALLSKEYALSMSRSPYTKNVLQKTDAVVIISADNPKSIPDAKVLTDSEIAALISFVESGGSLMVMLNSSVNDRLNESFEGVQLRKLLLHFGLDWNNVDTHYSDNVLAKGHPYFYDIRNFHYGAGCTINILPNATKPTILLNVYSDSTYLDRSVYGPGIVMVKPGKGKFILVGDAGSWTGNLSRPWADNTLVLQQLFRYMKPDVQVRPMQFDPYKTYTYAVEMSGLQAMPKDNTLSQIPLPEYQVYSPRPTTSMPYFEGSATLQLRMAENSHTGFNPLSINVKDFNWFGKPIDPEVTHSITAGLSKQGKVFEVLPYGRGSKWLAPDIASLVALLPTDGLQIGDTWESIEDVRIPSLRSTDDPIVKSKVLEITYISDTIFNQKACRVLQSYEEGWLKDWDISLDDILPAVENNEKGEHYQFLHERGGKILRKRQQYVDKVTGQVLDAKVQTRIIVWVHDKRRPIGIGNKEKDEQNIVSLATIIHFKLRK